MLEGFVNQELENPSPRKEVEDFIVYASRLFGWPPAGEPVLCDFGSAEKGDATNTRNAGPNVYRAPEVMLKMPWSYSVDIWNVGVLVCCRNRSFRRNVNGTLTLCRSGICTKEERCSLDKTPMARDTQLALTSQR